MNEVVDIGKQWKKVYWAGGCAALLSFFGTLADIIIGSMISSDLSTLPQTAVERFIEFEQNWLLGLYHLDFLNLIMAVIMLPVYFALFGLHRKRSLPYGALALLVALFGTTIFISANGALPMMELSEKYSSTGDPTQKMLLAAAGEAFLARGGHGSLGAFMGFISLTVASLSMSLVMFQGKIFSRKVSGLGIISYSLLFFYVLLVTFIPSTERVAVIMAAPGGLLALAWILLVGIKLLRLGSSPVE